LRVTIGPDEGGKLGGGTHVLALHLDPFATSVVTCTGIGTCAGKPLTTAGPFVIALAP